jgi:hypothetical protein
MPSTVEVYEKLKPKLGEEETQLLLAYLEQSFKQDVATKGDMQRLESDIQRLEAKIENRFLWLLGIMLTTWFATFMTILMKFPGS